MHTLAAELLCKPALPSTLACNSQGGRVEVRVAQAPSARAAQKHRNASVLDKAADPALTGAVSPLHTASGLMAAHVAMMAGQRPPFCLLLMIMLRRHHSVGRRCCAVPLASGYRHPCTACTAMD